MHIDNRRYRCLAICSTALFVFAVAVPLLTFVAWSVNKDAFIVTLEPRGDMLDATEVVCLVSLVWLIGLGLGAAVSAKMATHQQTINLVFAELHKTIDCILEEHARDELVLPSVDDCGPIHLAWVTRSVLGVAFYREDKVYAEWRVSPADIRDHTGELLDDSLLDEVWTLLFRLLERLETPHPAPMS